MDIRSFTAAMRPFMTRVLRDIGPRPACSEAEQQLGAMLEQDWAGFCDQVDLHSFHCHPRAFLGWLPWMVAAYLVALGSYWLLPPLSFLVACGTSLVILLQGVRFRELLDRLFPKEEGHNVVGVLRPRGEIERRVVLMAHQDSAYEFTLWYRFGNLSILLMLLMGLAWAWMTTGSLAASIAWSLGGVDHVAFTIIGVVGICLYPVVGLFVFLTAWSPVPGALDNLSGIALISALGRAAARGDDDGQRLLDGTEILLLATSSEEAGLRGARRFVASHRARLERMPTYVINIDSVGDPDHIALIDRELWQGARHDDALIELGLDCAQEHGLEIKRVSLALGGTDAAPFTHARIPSTTVIGQDSTRLIPNYHTRLDTIDHVDERAMEMAFQLVLTMMQRLDTGALELAREPAEGSWGGDVAEPLEPAPLPESP